MPPSITGKKDIEKALKKAEIEFESETEKITFGNSVYKLHLPFDFV